jgi:hypothetical protein
VPSLSGELRSVLEKRIGEAREIAEKAAGATVTALAVDRPESFPGMSDEQRRLRNTLRARARQLGKGLQTDGLQPLQEEIAYQQWHRMFFARFLAENGLLMHPSGVAVTLAECAELAPAEGEADAWLLAARYASAMLPGIFRRDDPSAQVRFAPEGRHSLETVLSSLPPAIFTADDALGWVYQFWQTKKKKEVNSSGRKIGGQDLAVVTQLFTEDYMVRFLLENSLGAWWAARHPASPLVKEWAYLRFRDDGAPAAGDFPGWPGRAAQVTVMDPCCGSGHFLVAAFEMLRRMRMEEEGLAAAAAADAVLRENLFGLELDPRCTQIAAFALALAAWKCGGYHPLPLPNVACSGFAVTGQLGDWTKLANGDAALQAALERLHQLFGDAPDLGSLINPADVPLRDRMFTADYAQVEPLLAQALAKERVRNDPVAAVFGAAAEGVLRAARLLAGKYTLVVTNVPYLTRQRQADVVRDYCEDVYPTAKADLATCFLERCLAFAAAGCSVALVTPQNWLFLPSYKTLRIKWLREATWNQMAWLGEHGFRSSAAAGAFTVLLVLTNTIAPGDNTIMRVDASASTTPDTKSDMLRTADLSAVVQIAQMGNPDARIVAAGVPRGESLFLHARSLTGLRTADNPQFMLCFWEVPSFGQTWVHFQSTTQSTVLYGGREHVLKWEHGLGRLKAFADDGLASLQGRAAWGRRGVVVSLMRRLPVTLYSGDRYDMNCGVIWPNSESDMAALWAFCSSLEFCQQVRRIDQQLKLTTATLLKIPFDVDYWRSVATKDYPSGLPEPYSNDPTQWLFGGQPVGATVPLQVAVARLLDYRWPQQPADALDAHIAGDGIACLPPVAGEPPAAERLRVLLAAAYGQAWSPAQQERLLAAVGYGGKGLDEWLRDGFFVQHCKLFHNRPFIWHIWDGRKDGFAALVNYHKLDIACLNRLIYTYLGTWINHQRAEREAGVAGADGRLVAALDLQKKLEAIRDGHPPYDIYVRWKPLHQQPIGWEPDLNDGLRLNVRPFVAAGVLRSKFTINWNKDRGRNPDDTERLNDRHYTVAGKQAARQAVSQPPTNTHKRRTAPRPGLPQGEHRGVSCERTRNLS